MKWNYRLVRTTRAGVGVLDVHEVYYDGRGRPTGMTDDPVVLDGFASKADFLRATAMIRRDVQRAPLFTPPKRWR